MSRPKLSLPTLLFVRQRWGSRDARSRGLRLPWRHFRQRWLAWGNQSGRLIRPLLPGPDADDNDKRRNRKHDDQNGNRDPCSIPHWRTEFFPVSSKDGPSQWRESSRSLQLPAMTCEVATRAGYVAIELTSSNLRVVQMFRRGFQLAEGAFRYLAEQRGSNPDRFNPGQLCDRWT